MNIKKIATGLSFMLAVVALYGFVTALSAFDQENLFEGLKMAFVALWSLLLYGLLRDCI